MAQYQNVGYAPMQPMPQNVVYAPMQPMPQKKSYTGILLGLGLVAAMIAVWYFYIRKVSSPLVGKFNADNYLSIKLNDVQVYEEQGIDWGTAHSVNLPEVKSGDRVDFNVRNVGGPGGFIGSFTWNGKTYDVNNTLFPGNVAVTGPGPWGQPILDLYPSTAQWIWSQDNCETCVVKFAWVAA